MTVPLLSSCFAQGKTKSGAATPVMKNTSLTLAANGQSAYTIALAADAIPAEKTAAQQLQKYLQQVTGATLPIAPESEVQAGAPQILVGAGKRARTLLPLQKWDALGSDGIVIKTAGNKLVIAGGRRTPARFAVCGIPVSRRCRRLPLVDPYRKHYSHPQDADGAGAEYHLRSALQLPRALHHIGALQSRVRDDSA